MSLLEAVGCICFQNHLKKTSSELENKNPAQSKKVEIKSKIEHKLEEINKNEGELKLKCHFTMVNRNAVEDKTGKLLGDFILDKDKNI